MDDLASYDYYLPPELIAKEPLPERDASRMLLLDRSTGRIEHRRIADLPEILRRGDRLVFNDTQVMPARLFGRRRATGGKWEGLFLRSLPDGNWELIGHSGGRLRAGDEIDVVPAHTSEATREFSLTLLAHDGEGIWTARPSLQQPAMDFLRQFGTVPLPPYVRRKLASPSDWERYQTAYARRPGAVAAPTAGLHFTDALLASCRARGIDRSFVTLHVGIGTFRPIAFERLDQHVMHSEWCEISSETCEQLEHTRRAGRRIVAVGTTSVRTLETSDRDGAFRPWSGETQIFIRPPHVFGGVDCLLTNFHLPRSSLLVLVSAFAGLDRVLAAYDAAVKERYRFFSYGDCMLIL